jgi:voltage-gated potassium channel
MTGKTLQIINGFLCLADVILLIFVFHYSQTVSGAEIIATLVFDIIVVVLVAFDFYGRLRKSNQGWRYILHNWFEIPIMFPILIFVLPESSQTIYAAITTIGIMFRGLGILYLFRFVVKNSLNIFGTNKALHVLIAFYVMLGVIAVLFYDAERLDTNSSIKTIGDSFWYLIQMASGATFGPSPVTTDGKIIGAIAMIVGSALTGIYISIFAVEYITRSVVKQRTSLGFETKQTIISKIESLEDLSSAELKLLLSMISTLHENLEGSKQSS